MRHQWTLAMAMAVTVVAFGQKTDSPEAMLGRGLHLEEVEADCKEAINIYQALIKQKNAPPNLAARAQLHIGMCQEQLGQREARAAYETVVREYRDQRDIVQQAQTRLASLGRGQDDSSRQAALKPRLICRNCGASGNASLTPHGILAFINGPASPDAAARQDGTLEARDLSRGSRGEVTRWVIGARTRLRDGAGLISPDGKQIATIGRNFLMLTSNVSGSSPVQIQGSSRGNGTLVAWSPDGTSILSTNIGGGRGLGQEPGAVPLVWLSVVDGSIREVADFGVFYNVNYMGGGGPRLVAFNNSLSDTPMLALSPDGQFIAYSPFVAADAKQSHIYLVTANGSGTTPLVTDASFNWSPVWTPDGKRILFISDRTGTKDLWSVEVRDGKASGTPSLLFKDIEGIPVRNGITRDGTLYYIKTAGPSDRVFVVDMEAAGAKIRGSAPHIIASLEGRRSTLSPDGKFIVYDKGGSPIIYSVETGEERVLDYATRNAAGKLAWLHDSSGFLQWRQGSGGDSLYRVDAGSGKSTKVLQTDSFVTGMNLSPDEKTVYSKEDRDIMAFDLDTGSRRKVYTGSARARLAAWALSHDGRTLALLSLDNIKGPTIARVGIDGTDFETLFTPERTISETLAWTANDRGILFGEESDGNTRIMSVPANGGPPESTGLDVEYLLSLSLSADGSRLAYSTTSQPTSEIWSLDLSSKLGK